MLSNLRKLNSQLVVKKNIYCLNLLKFNSIKIDKLSLKKKKSFLEFNLLTNMLNNQKYYIVENNVKFIEKRIIKDCKVRKLVKSGVFLSDNVIFNEKNQIKYNLRLLTFSCLNSLNIYLSQISKYENSLPSLIKINFLFFKKLTFFFLYFTNFTNIYINFSIRLKLITDK